MLGDTFRPLFEKSAKIKSGDVVLKVRPLVRDVRDARAAARRRAFQKVVGGPFSKVLPMPDTRKDPLRWEQEYYGIGWPGWKDLVQR